MVWGSSGEKRIFFPHMEAEILMQSDTSRTGSWQHFQVFRFTGFTGNSAVITRDGQKIRILFHKKFAGFNSCFSFGSNKNRLF